MLAGCGGTGPTHTHTLSLTSRHLLARLSVLALRTRATVPCCTRPGPLLVAAGLADQAGEQVREQRKHRRVASFLPAMDVQWQLVRIHLEDDADEAGRRQRHQRAHIPMHKM